MFAQTFLDTPRAVQRPWTLAVSLGLQTVAVGAVLLVPLLHPEILQPTLRVPTWVQLRVRPEPPSPPQVKTAGPSRPSAPPVFTAPREIPKSIARVVDPIADAPEAPGIYVPGSFSADGAVGVPGAVLPTALPEKPQPVPRAAPKPPDGPLRVSSSIQAAKLLFGPKPPYPPLAKAARVQGTVRLQAVIAADGRISGLRVVSGPSLLMNAAVEAVKQWRYQPTLLNNAPVEIATEIDVIFTLSQ